MDSTTQNASDVQALKADLAKAKEEIAELSGTLVQVGGKSAKIAKENLAAVSSAAAKKANEYVHEHPIQSAVIAFGVGAVVGGLVGMLIAQRRS